MLTTQAASLLTALALEGQILPTGLLAVIAVVLVILFIWLLLRLRSTQRPPVRTVPDRMEPYHPVSGTPAVPAAPIAAKAAPAAASVETVEPASAAPIGLTAADPVEHLPAEVSVIGDQPVDDLEIIEGIGPKIAGVLKAAGISTFAQLAALDPDRITEILQAGGIRLADTRSWPEQARLAASGDHSRLKELQDRLKGGREV